MSDKTETQLPPEGGSTPRPCSSSSVKLSDVLICMIDEWRKGEKEPFDCHITSKRKDGVDVCYLSGYRSRNDFVPWADVVARVDLSWPIVSVANGAFRGHFEVFLPMNAEMRDRHLEQTPPEKGNIQNEN